jgi:hypothetical protein
MSLNIDTKYNTTVADGRTAAENRVKIREQNLLLDQMEGIKYEQIRHSVKIIIKEWVITPTVGVNSGMKGYLHRLVGAKSTAEKLFTPTGRCK